MKKNNYFEKIITKNFFFFEKIIIKTKLFKVITEKKNFEKLFFIINMQNYFF